MNLRNVYIVPFIIVTFTIAVAYAVSTQYPVEVVEVDVEVLEAISIEPTEFSFFMFPGEEERASFEVCNDSSADLTVSYAGGVTPAGQGVTVTIPAPNDVEGGSCEEKSINVVAFGNAVPQVYRVTVSVGRE